MKRRGKFDLGSFVLGITLALSLSIAFTFVFHLTFSPQLLVQNCGLQQFALGFFAQNNISTNPDLLPQKNEPRVKPPELVKNKGISLIPEPDVMVVTPAVRITHWRPGDRVYGETIGPGTVTALFKFSVMNTGGRLAKDVTTEWLIKDNGSTITGPDEWAKTIGKSPWAPFDLAPGKIAEFTYGPHIGARGSGTLELILSIAYTDPETGAPIRKEYKGFVDYLVEQEGQSKGYVLSPSPKGDSN